MPKDHPMYISSQSIWGGAGDTDLGFLFFFHLIGQYLWSTYCVIGVMLGMCVDGG